MASSRGWQALLLMGAVGLFAVGNPACSKSGGGGGGGGRPGEQEEPPGPGSGPGTPDGGGTTTGPDAGTEPVPCRTDVDCGGGRICLPSGTCVQPLRCDPGEGPVNCTGQGYCQGRDLDNPTCVCLPDPLAPESGTCRLRLDNCAGCGESVECGNTSAWTLPRDCMAFQGVPVCLTRAPGPGRACPPGYLRSAPDTFPGGAIYCVPQSGSCAQGACQNDDQCPMGQVCDAERGLCIESCEYDFQLEASQRCPNGKVCHAVERYLRPGTPPQFLARGRCGRPCDQAQDPEAFCRAYAPVDRCVSEGPTLREPLASFAAPESRCRPPPPACVSDHECPASSPYVGYCDVATLSCVRDRCREDGDCAPGNECVAATRTCQPRGCIREGGAHTACGVMELCCGEPLPMSHGDAYTRPCPEGVEPGACHPAPPIWCAPCQGHADCNFPDDPGRAGRNWCDGTCLFSCLDTADCPNGFRCLAAGQVACDPAAGGAPCLKPESCQKSGENPQTGEKLYSCACADAAQPGSDPQRYDCPVNAAVGAPTSCDPAGRWCILGTYCSSELCPAAVR
jgi:hypothetical protein